MLRPEFLHDLQVELQNITGKYPTLLGGSYVYGEPSPESDVDFFVILPFYKFYKFRSAIKEWKKSHSEALINIMLVPATAYKHGWYYVYGRTVSGELMSAPLNKAMSVRSALKLAYFNYLRYVAGSSAIEKNTAIQKMAQKIGIVYSILKNRGPTPPLSTSHLKNNVPSSMGWVSDLLTTRQQGATPRSVSEDEAERTLEQAYLDTREFHGFSLATYAIYNFKFLSRGKALFLWQNPDTMILKKIREGLEKKTDLARLIDDLTPIIFPVIII